ncbi:ubiquitin-conjugating enzyme E2, putative [Trypanosoma brucei brucei TREU927]|uniref:Ubiquitin-conjugating enzyme E2, putative n=1 Tax=Trypanosoma brucei brucei (strain 927/4 GUTat10.1) TaxID=185431 RepID=Q583Z6_TRYB2|nr:ubiquitin-conjugating enzyme E2, putative [Trypanosoma brucei brucei TREU927]AAX79825.1 ubiquitin-conjugating enzyme E2, putative [Trypanosoma brucei]AAZ10910.1 ubiquitin-conjugating enzyme E2, putative [Trypanosoma brucei brucei TREU927]
MPAPPAASGVRRLQKELRDITLDPPPYCNAAPSSESIFTWYFTLDGLPQTPYEGGRYVGELRFPPEYPMKAPKIIMLTPSGRFVINSPICLTITDFHPEEWSPMWGVRTIITGLLSFMVSEESGLGGMTATAESRRALAAESHRYNVERVPVYKELFNSEYQKDLKKLNEEAEALRKNCGDVSEHLGNKTTNAGRAQLRGIVASIVVLVALAVGLLVLRN